MVGATTAHLSWTGEATAYSAPSVGPGRLGAAAIACMHPSALGHRVEWAGGTPEGF